MTHKPTQGCLFETTFCAGWRETGSKSSIVRRLIYMDAQDGQDYRARVSTVMSSTIASVPTRISQGPLQGSWITANTRPIIKWVCFCGTASRAVYPVYPVHPCSIYSLSRLIFPVAGLGCAQRPDSQSASRAATSFQIPATSTVVHYSL